MTIIYERTLFRINNGALFTGQTNLFLRVITGIENTVLSDIITRAWNSFPQDRIGNFAVDMAGNIFNITLNDLQAHRLHQDFQRETRGYFKFENVHFSTDSDTPGLIKMVLSIELVDLFE